MDRLNRRSVLKYAGLFAAVPFVGQLLDKSTLLAAGANKFSTDLVLNGEVITGAHWGILKVKVKDGKIVSSTNALSGYARNNLQEVVKDCVDGKLTARIKAPMVRKSFLEGKPNNNKLRGGDEWVEVSYEQAIKLAAKKITEVRKAKGSTGIYGGSYGWQSSGKLHNARTLLQRFLGMSGGFVGGLGDYSTGAAQVIMGHVLGTLEVYEQQTSWPLVLENSKVVVIWGANPIATLKIAWSATDSQGLKYFEALRDSGKRIICIDPLKSETVEFFGKKAQWVSVTPNTDVALMMGIAHTMLSSGKYNKDFLDSYTEGFDKFSQYLMGKSDKVVKDAKWASKICGVSEKTIKEFANLFYENRTMLMAGWAMQRQHHGEQPHWMLVTLASMIGQIGLPGGGFGFSYHYSNGGVPTTNAPMPGGITTGKPAGKEATWLKDDADLAIPVARIADCLANPGKVIDYNGRKITYPDIDLVYWVGGNPLNQHQNTNTMVEAWKKPSTVIVNEMYWTPTARHADIVFPITTSYERNDITMTGDYSNLNIVPMKQVVARMPKAKHDYEVFADLAKEMGFGEQYTEGKSEMEWLEGFYNQAFDQAKAGGLEIPSFKDFWSANKHLTFDPTPEGEAFVRYADFVEDPILNPLGTPSGKIEIYSKTIEAMKYDDCFAHPTWFEPVEWLGMKNKPAQFALISAHPVDRLHSQLANTSLRSGYAVNDREPILINKEDAKKKGIKNGDIVRVFNSRGSVLAGAVVTDRVPKNVVRIFEGAWFDPSEPGKAGALCKNGCPNVLTIDIPSSKLANGNISDTALVDIEKYKGKAPKITVFTPPKGA